MYELIEKSTQNQPELKQMVDYVMESNIIQVSSSKLLLFHVEDVLGMAQLKQGKFRKIESRFNIKSAVEEIRSIEQYTADAKQIKMTIEYFNFPNQIARP